MLFLLALFAVAAAIWWIGKAARQKQDASQPHYLQPTRSVADAVPSRFVVFDFETTGLNANEHEIIEIGAIRVNRDASAHETFQTFIRSVEPVPAFITKLTGISDDMLQREGIPLAQAMQDFSAFVGDLPMVAFNAKFDKSFLRQASKATGFAFPNKISCALVAARQAWPGRNSYTLADLSRDGGLNMDDSHRALGDCQRALLVYVAACRAI